MKHVDAFETTALPEGLGREFVADAPCVAVLVEAGDDAVQEGPSEPPTGRSGAVVGGSQRRASATVFRVGDGYVVECEDPDGAIETVGMGPGQLDAYVERVRRDDAWTVLSIGDGEAGARSRAGGRRLASDSPTDQ